MKNTQHNDCGDIIELLVKKYWSESKRELDQKIAQIAQDFIGRKLFNSTVRVSKQLHTEFAYVQKLIEYIFETLKQDFSHIPLVNCKDKLLSIVEIEYENLIPNTTSRLVQANLGQKGILEQYKKGIIGEMEKAKAKIEIQCAVAEKEKLVAKVNGENWYRNRTIQAALIGLGGLLFVSIVGWLIILYKSDGRSDVVTLMPTAPEISNDSSHRTVPMDPNIPVVDHNNPESIQRDEELIQPEEIEGNVNRAKPSHILKIPDAAISPEEATGEVNEPKTFEDEQAGKSVYEPGSALLEIFKIDPDKQEIPDLPIIRTYWKNHLAFSHRICLLPERASEIGRGSYYAAKFSFYYEAKQSGKYGFTIVNMRRSSYTDFSFGVKGNAFKITIGGIDIVKVGRESMGHGVCNLAKGFHRVEFWFADKVGVPASYPRGFQVKVLAPGAFDAVAITKDMLLLKND